MIKEIKLKTKKRFRTTHNLKSLEPLSKEQLVKLLEDETDIKLRNGFDYTSKTTKKALILMVLKKLSDPNRSIFKNEKTVEWF